MHTCIQTKICFLNYNIIDVVYTSCDDDFFALIPSPVLTQSLNLLRILLNSMNSL